MNMTPSQWGMMMGAGGKALDAPNAMVYQIQMARAGRCMPLPGWQQAIMSGGPVQLMCYDSQGNEAGVRDLSAVERKGIMDGVREVTPDGFLSRPGDVLGGPYAIAAGGGGTGPDLGTLVTLGAVAAAGWWVYDNWSMVKGWISPSKPLQRVRVRPLSAGDGDLDDEE